MDSRRYDAYVKILKEELVPAMGCTEPIAIAYAAALARDTLGDQPEQMEIQASGNLIKNVKSVVVPNTGGRRGIEAAVAAGVIAGDADRVLEVISRVTPEQKTQIGALADSGINIRMIDLGSSEINIIVGVESADFERAVNAIYNAFLK